MSVKASDERGGYYGGRFKNRSGVSELGGFKTARARQFWIGLTENNIGCSTVSYFYVIMTYRFYVVDSHKDNWGDWPQNVITSSWGTPHRTREFRQNPIITF